MFLNKASYAHKGYVYDQKGEKVIFKILLQFQLSILIHYISKCNLFKVNYYYLLYYLFVVLFSSHKDFFKLIKLLTLLKMTHTVHILNTVHI